MRLLVVLIALALAPALVACGGEEDARRANAYVDAVNRAQGSFAETFTRLSRGIGTTSTAAEDRRTLRQFEEAVDETVRRLRSVDVPEDVRLLHTRLVAQVAGYGDEIAKARRALRSEQPARVLEAQTALVSAVTALSSRINATIDAINRRLSQR